MNKFFNTIRWILVIIIIVPIFLLIVGNGIIGSTALTFTNPDNPKKWLSEGEVYENVVQLGVNELLSRIGEVSEDQSVEVMSRGLATEQEAREIADKVFPPEWVKSQTESLIDSVYAFLNDETEDLEFSIDVSEASQNARGELGTLFKNKLDSLPECEEGSDVSMDNFNLLSVNCIPPEANRSVLHQEIDTAVQDMSFLEKTTFTQEDLDVKTEDFKDIKPIFSISKVAPALLLLIILLLNYIVFFLVPGVSKKFKTSGYLWGVGGITLILISTLAKLKFPGLFTDLIVKNISPERASIIEILRPPIELAYGDLTNLIILWGIADILFGVALIVIGKINE